MGTPDFSVPILSMLRKKDIKYWQSLHNQIDLLGENEYLTPPPVKVEAERLGIPVIQPEKLMDSS